MVVAWDFTSLRKYLCELVQILKFCSRKGNSSPPEQILSSNSTRTNMDGGVILFADDMVYENSSFENKFFHSLISEKKYPILGVDNIELLEKTVRSISTYKALIVDWNFQRIDEEHDELGIEVPDENPGDFLLKNDIFSLIYIYSDKDIERTDIGKQLSEKYGAKLKFKKKDNSKATAEDSASAEKAIILEEIGKFESSNTSLVVPYLWSQSINRSTQQIFRELEVADPNWVKDIYQTAKTDGGEPISEVINVFQHLLGEAIIQSSALKEKIDALIDLPDVPVADKEVSVAKLYNRLFYTRLTADAPIMTGDIFTFDAETFGILVTPECDVNERKSLILDFLIIKRSGFNGYLAKKQYQRGNFDALGKDKKKSVLKSFNQDEIKYQILPSFPFEENVYNESAVLDFSSALTQIKAADFNGKRGNFKLNSPYIHQLRQRYLAYVGRVGVPSIPESLRIFNIK